MAGHPLRVRFANAVRRPIKTLSLLVGLSENFLILSVLALLTVLPLIEFAGREGIGRSVSGSIPITQHLTLWLTFIGAAIAARGDRLLALSTTSILRDSWRELIRVATYGAAAAIASSLVYASAELVLVDYEYGAMVAWGVPVWVISLVMPISFALICAHLIWHASRGKLGRLVASAAAFSPWLLISLPAPETTTWFWFMGGIIVALTILGLPIFAAIAGTTLVCFWAEGTPVSAVPGEAYRMATSPMLPAIPLFTFAGYVMSKGNASKRLLRFFSALMGNIPGGLAIVTTLLLAFFTPLTGASGITILAIGGLLLPLLTQARYPEQTAIGLVTVSGSIGVLFPPSLPVILYAFYAEVDLKELFVGGLIPGVILVIAVAAWGAYKGTVAGAPRIPFSGKELIVASRQAKWEILLPVAIIFAIFGGFTTLVEAAAMTVIYSLIIECIVYRDVSITKDLAKVAVEATKLVGGFMIILGVAFGLTNYLIIAQVPMHALQWVQGVIDSPVVFLLALNVLLIIVGALMDIYSAIILVVPLITPIAYSYGIHPVHLGVIFMANMQLGYLMPPMGENLFLAAYRFDRDLGEIYRSTIPFVIILLITVLAITYAPWLTLWPLSLIGD